MRIEYLADFPEYLHTVNNWTYEEWGHLSPKTKEERLNDLKGRLNKNMIPLTFIALKGDKPVGTASIFKYDMETHKHLSPWLAAVFVDPEHRREGIGSRLVKRILKKADNLGYKTLYLFTPDMMNFYRQLGWKEKEIVNYKNMEVTIMEYNF
ncbi:MAG: GNAT family N-acetyltransferase [bacterium]